MAGLSVETWTEKQFQETVEETLEGCRHVLMLEWRGVEYISLYSRVYKCCIAKINRERVLGGRSTRWGTANDQSPVRLFNAIKEFLEEFCTTRLGEIESQRSNEEFLNAFGAMWNAFDKGLNAMNEFCSYLNKRYEQCRSAQKSSRHMADTKSFSGAIVPHVETVGLNTFRKVLFERFRKRLIGSVLDPVRKARAGEAVTLEAVRAVIACIVRLGSKNKDKPMDLYEKEVEASYLKDAREHYAREGARLIASVPIAEYVRVVDRWLRLEEDRAKTLLFPESVPRVCDICNEVLVIEPRTRLEEECRPMIEANRVDDLRHMHFLLSRVSGGIDPLRTAFKMRLKIAGVAALEAHNLLPRKTADAAADGEGGDGGGAAAADAGAAAGGGGAAAGAAAAAAAPTGGRRKKERIGKDDPRNFAHSMLTLHQHHHEIVKSAFADDPIFQRTMDEGVEETVNMHSRAPEMLARYADILLRKGSREAKDAKALEEWLNHIVLLFKYIVDKDVFQVSYHNMLAKRLMHGASASDDAETLMIDLLKTERGTEFVQKMKRMFQDMAMAEDNDESFRKYMETRGGGAGSAVDARVLVLQYGSWPMPRLPDKAFNNPPEIEHAVGHFNDFYQSKHSGRRLLWLFHESRGDLKTAFLPRQQCILSCTSFQIGILLLFNEADRYSAQELAEHTNLPTEWVTRSLKAMVEIKLLRVDDAGSHRLNLKWKPGRARLNLARGSQVEAKEEDDQTRKQVGELREFGTQAAIVRLMKSRKTLTHTELIKETLRLLSGFRPQVSMIKKQIEHLIEKDYLKRERGLSGKTDSYSYIA